MRYIVCKPLHKKCITGEIDLIKGTTLNEKDGEIFYNGKLICYASSQTAYDYLSKDVDHDGFERFKLVHNIINKISKLNAKFIEHYNEEYKKLVDPTEEQLEEIHNHIGENPAYIIYQDLPENFKVNGVYSFQFYNANIETLEDIWNKIKDVEINN